MGDRLKLYRKPNLEKESLQNEQLLHDLDEAYEAWQLALHHFNQALDPDAVDDAIYLLIAAEKRYEGLLRIARRKHLAVAMGGEISSRSGKVGITTGNGHTASR